MGWLIALGILTLLLILPLGASLRYDSSGTQIRLILGILQIPVFPGKKKAPKKDKKKPKEKKKKPAKTPAKKTAAVPKTKKKGGPITDFIPLVYVVLDFLADLPRIFRIGRLDVNLILGGGDPADLGQNYGKACAAMGNLIPRIEEMLVIRRRNVQIQCDFEADSTVVTARLDITVTMARTLGFLLRYGIRGIREFTKIMNKRKGGAAI